MATKRKHSGNVFTESQRRRHVAGHRASESRTVDLETEEVFDAHGRRVTAEYVADAVDEIEDNDVQVDESRVEFRRRGRPSLTGHASRSPRIDIRVSDELKARVARQAKREGRRESDIARAALEDYLSRR